MRVWGRYGLIAVGTQHAASGGAPTMSSRGTGHCDVVTPVGAGHLSTGGHITCGTVLNGEFGLQSGGRTSIGRRSAVSKRRRGELHGTVKVYMYYCFQ